MNVISWLTGAAPLLLFFRPSIIPSDQTDSIHSILGRGRMSGLSPVKMATHFPGTSGYYQGLVTAVSFSSKDDTSFFENALKALKRLFPVVALKLSVVQDSIEGEDGQPTPMLSINGLISKTFNPHLQDEQVPS